MPYVFQDFSGGLNLFTEDINLNDNEYSSAFNIRNRKTSIEPIKLPIEDTTAPSGKKQGCYAFDKFVLLFCAGRAYYKNIVTNSAWTQIAQLALDTDVDYIYVCVVPASTFNFTRKLAKAEQISGSNLLQEINVENIVINGTVSGLVVQDGINRPWIIFPDGSARTLADYDDWTLASREYVPVMKQMCFMNGILFGVAPDGTTIYRSVSGRPLDFVVNVDINGNKGGNASTTSYRVSFNPVTFLGPVSSGSLFVGTLTTCFLVDLDYDTTIFAEPTFLNTRPMSVGITNQFSFVDILGDYAFIDIDGIRSFNAVAQETNEGRNSVFSAKINPALLPKQTTTAAIVFDNFSFFAINSAFGNAMAVYDNIRTQWVCLDDYDFDEQFIMFAVANQSDAPILYAITPTKVYTLFNGTQNASASVKLKTFISGDPRTQLRLKDVFVTLRGSTKTGILTLKEYEDDDLAVTVKEDLKIENVQNIKFQIRPRTSQCAISAIEMTWDNDARLVMVSADADGMMQTPIQQTSKQFSAA